MKKSRWVTFTGFSEVSCFSVRPQANCQTHPLSRAKNESLLNSYGQNWNFVPI